jgi:hypothetical protein
MNTVQDPKPASFLFPRSLVCRQNIQSWHRLAACSGRWLISMALVMLPDTSARISVFNFLNHLLTKFSFWQHTGSTSLVVDSPTVSSTPSSF